MTLGAEYGILKVEVVFRESCEDGFEEMFEFEKARTIYVNFRNTVNHVNLTFWEYIR